MSSTATCCHFLASFSSKLNGYRREEQFCDVILTVDNQQYNAHRAVLAASSNYFQKLFTSSMIEKTSQTINLEIPATIAEELLTFLYTRKIVLHDENVKDLLVAADYLMIDDLKQLCLEYFYQSLSISNCLPILFLAMQYHCLELVKHIERYFIKRFTLLWRSNEFKLLEADQLITFLSSEDLLVESEQEVYEAILSWVEYQVRETTSRVSFDALFRCVRLSSLSQDFVVNIMSNNEYVKQSKTCTDLLMLRLSPTNIPCTPRKCLQAREESIVCIGGRADGKTLQTVQTYQPYYNTWIQKHDTLCEKEEHTLVTYNNILYVIGGLKSPTRVECYKQSDNEWNTIGHLTYKAISSASVCVDGKIVVIGGTDGFKTTSWVQCFDISNKTVTTLPSLPLARQALTAVNLHGEIYVMGGYSHNNIYNAVNKISLSNESSWQQMTPMRHQRKYACAHALGNDKILVIGGYQDDSTTALNSCEVYNAASNDWHDICSLNVPRGAASLGCIGNRVYVLGGKSRGISTDTIEYYDDDDDCHQWRVASTRLPYKCAWLKCGVLSNKYC